MNKWNREDFQGRENTLYDTVMMDTFVQTHKCRTPRVNHNVNYGLWVIVMCQCRSISCNKGSTLLGSVDNREG